VIKRHYKAIFARLKRLDQILTALPRKEPTRELRVEKKKPTAVMLVGNFSGLGIHSLLTVMKLFPRYFHNVVFMSVGVVDSATFQGVEEVDRVRDQTEEALKRYVELARGLARLDIKFISTGGTAATLRESGVPVTPLSDVTGFPEILGGRVKTLHPAVHGGLLAVRGNPTHAAELARHGIRPIDLVAVTLYPFEAALARGAAFPEMIEEIDIGGVTLLRAAAKNFAAVAVLSDPGQYAACIEAMGRGGPSLSERRDWAAAAFRRCEQYDIAISSYFDEAGLSDLPETLRLTLERAAQLRYGENPQTRAAFYLGTAQTTLPKQLWGKTLSFNNLLDMEAAVKHCATGASGWPWASNEQEAAPDVVLASAGDIPTLETVAAA